MSFETHIDEAYLDKSEPWLCGVYLMKENYDRIMCIVYINSVSTAFVGASGSCLEWDGQQISSN